MRLLVIFLAFAVAQAADFPAKQAGNYSTGRIAPQIVAGGAWETELHVVNANDEAQPVPYTIRFRDSAGADLPLQVFDQDGRDLGKISTIAAVAPVSGGHVYRLPPTNPTTLAGYASIEPVGFRQAILTAVVTQHVPGRPDFQAGVPALDSARFLRFIFRNSPPYTTTFALVAEFGPVNATIRALNFLGVEQCKADFALERQAHKALILTELLPCMAGADGVVEISGNGPMAGIGFLANDFGAFTTVLPVGVCCP